MEIITSTYKTLTLPNQLFQNMKISFANFVSLIPVQVKVQVENNQVKDIQPEDQTTEDDEKKKRKNQKGRKDYERKSRKANKNKDVNTNWAVVITMLQIC